MTIASLTLPVSITVPCRNSIPGCGGKPRLMRQPAMHEELSIDMSSSSSPPRLGVRFLPTIPSAADSSIILDDTDSVAENGGEQLAGAGREGESSSNNHHHQLLQEVVVNLAEGEDDDQDENADESDDGDDDDGLEMRLGSESVRMNEKRGSSDSGGGEGVAGATAAGTYQAFYTVLGTCGNTMATLASPSKDGGRPP